MRAPAYVGPLVEVPQSDYECGFPIPKAQRKGQYHDATWSRYHFGMFRDAAQNGLDPRLDYVVPVDPT